MGVVLSVAVFAVAGAAAALFPRSAGTAARVGAGTGALALAGAGAADAAAGAAAAGFVLSAASPDSIACYWSSNWRGTRVRGSRWGIGGGAMDGVGEVKRTALKAAERVQ